jgi:hypothetical protein
MAKDEQCERSQVFIQLMKRVLDDKIAEATPMLQIFAVENLAAALSRRRNDEGVVPCKLIFTM